MPIPISKWLSMERPDGEVRMSVHDRITVRNDPFFFRTVGRLNKQGGFPKPIHVLCENGKPCDKWINAG